MYVLVVNEKVLRVNILSLNKDKRKIILWNKKNKNILVLRKVYFGIKVFKCLKVS